MKLRAFWPGAVALLVALAVGLLAWDRLPDRVPVHWNFRGEADRWGSPGEVIFLLPGTGLLILGLLAVLPTVDPKRENHALHSSAYVLTGNAVLVFLAALHLLILAVSAGYEIRMNRVLAIGIGVLLMVIGNVLTQARQNWFFGIRTPWTLTSERSWRATHRLGGRLWVAGGLLLVLVGVFAPQWFGLGIVAGVGIPTLIAVVYSYQVWRQERQATTGGGK